jgi:hypothetical protein
MKCALCQQPAVLCDSHIIPEFFYKPLYDAKHRFSRVSSNLGRQDAMLQKGIREHLLCEKCETYLSRYEGYFKRAFLDGGIGEMAEDGRCLRIRGLDYKSIKLLFLSILWRMGVSSLKFFRQVKLGPHQEKLRMMLMMDDPGVPTDYGFLTVAPFLERQLGNWITPPDSECFGANRLYRIVMGGVLFIFFVPGRDLPSKITGLFLQADGHWIIVREKVENIEFLYRYVIEIGEAIHKRRAKYH